MITSASGVRLAGVLVLCLLGAPLAAPGAEPQEPAPLVTAAAIDSLLDRLQTVVRGPNSQSAEPDIRRAIDAARERSFEAQAARGLLTLGEWRRIQRQWDAALPPAREALEIYERLGLPAGVGRAHDLLGRVSSGRGDLGSAIVHAERAVDAFASARDDDALVSTVDRLARLDGIDLDRVRPLVERAASSARAEGHGALEGVVLHGFADRLFTVERYEESMAVLERAKAAYESAGALEDLGTVYNSIGRVYRAHGRLDEALRFQKAALDLHRRGNDRVMLVQSLNAVAVVYQRLNDWPQARTYLEEALTLAATIESPTVQDFLRANMAGVLIEVGRLDEAVEAYEQVIARGFDAFPALRLLQLSGLYGSLGRREDAFVAANRAVSMCGSANDLCANALGARSRAHAALGRADAALADVSSAVERIESLRAQLMPSDFLKQGFLRVYQHLYDAAIALQLDRGDDRQALETAELARSRAFLDLLASRSLPPTPMPPGADLSFTLRGGSVEAGAATAVRAQATPASAADLGATAARLGSTLVLYWVGSDQTFVWVVNRDGTTHARRVAVRQTRLAALVQRSSPFAADERSGQQKGTVPGPRALREVTAALRELYGLLIAPVRDLLPTSPGALLTIVPHDALSALSFAALQDRRGRYLLEDYTLHYAPAGAMFQFTALLPPLRPRAGAMLLVSDPAPSRRSPLDAALPRLPGARKEAAAIERLMPGQVTALQDAAATEARVRELAPGRSILHFATHAVVRDDDPFASFLALGPSVRDGAEDGVFTAQDVYGLHLHADLVVLTACRSANGYIAGDGMATFARAFLYAGTASFVASVWDVADEPANRLVPDFYRAWLDGASKAAALRRAQLRLLADLRAGRVRVKVPIGEVAIPEHPVFWAGFVLFGEP